MGCFNRSCVKNSREFSVFFHRFLSRVLESYRSCTEDLKGVSFCKDSNGWGL